MGSINSKNSFLFQLHHLFILSIKMEKCVNQLLVIQYLKLLSRPLWQHQHKLQQHPSLQQVKLQLKHQHRKQQLNQQYRQMMKWPDKRKSKEKLLKQEKKIEQVRREKAKKAADEQREKEKQRREMGQKAAEIQQEREQAELQRIAEKRRKEKIADAEARARVKKQIKEDRRARNAKYDEKHEEEMKAKQAELDQIKAQKLREEREKLEEQRRLRDTCARIQFRFHDGSTRTESFGADEPLSKARDFVVENQICDRFVLGTSFPKRRFTSEEESQSFRQLGLTPSTALTVIPIQSAISNSSNGLVSTIMAIIMIPINIVLSILSSITGNATNATQQPTASSAGPSSSNNPNLRRRKSLFQFFYRKIEPYSEKFS